jgi:hypothetical protein
MIESLILTFANLEANITFPICVDASENGFLHGDVGLEHTNLGGRWRREW